MVGVRVPAPPGGAVAGGYELATEAGSYAVQGSPAGFALSDSVTVALTRGERPEGLRIDPSMLRWFLTPQGAALAAWLSLLYLLLRDM
jgi:hypothetical protein